MQQLREVLADFPGLSLSFTQPIDMRVQEMISGVRGDVAVKIFGPDIAKLNEIAARLSAILSGIDGAEDVYTTLNEGAQYYTVAVNRLEAGRLGLTVDAIADSLRTQIEGRTDRHRPGGRPPHADPGARQREDPRGADACWPICR